VKITQQKQTKVNNQVEIEQTNSKISNHEEKKMRVGVSLND
jgi:hypothetical protein